MVFVRTLLFGWVDSLSRPRKRALLLTIDIALAPLALAAALLIVRSAWMDAGSARDLWQVFVIVAALAGLVSSTLGIPRIKLNAYEAAAILKTGVFAAVLTFCLSVVVTWGAVRLPVAGIILFGLVLFVMAVVARVSMLHLLLWILASGRPRCRVLIYGAGNTGRQLAAALHAHDSIVPVAFVDDDPARHAEMIAGLKVYPPDRISRLVRDRDIHRILLAMPSVSAPKLSQITRKLQAQGIEVHALPSFSQLIGTERLVDTLAPVDTENYLGRNRVHDVVPQGIDAYAGRVVLVSGAGGSVGGELCRQLLIHRPARLILFEISEIALYTIDRELRTLDAARGIEIMAVLGSVTDARMARMVMQDHGVEVVFHAAAYKHVPLVEANPVAGVSNNVLGTRTLADAAIESEVGRFILISTDKAVRPTNVMGASKRLAELVVQDLARRSATTVFSMVRFGNVLWSSGSVLPLFREQIAAGGPVTLTHEDVTRYCMSIDEAARLVLLAGSYAEAGGPAGGDVFVLDMGQAVKIRHLAERMIEDAGYSVRNAANPDGDVEIVVTGLRPGEKLHEELLIGEGLLTTPHHKILRARETCLTELQMATALRALRAAVATGDAEGVLAVLRANVEGFGEGGTIVAAPHPGGRVAAAGS